MALSRKKRARRAKSDVKIIVTHAAETASRRVYERLLEDIVVEVRRLELAAMTPPPEALLSLCDRAEVVLGLKEGLPRRKKRPQA